MDTKAFLNFSSSTGRIHGIAILLLKVLISTKGKSFKQLKSKVFFEVVSWAKDLRILSSLVLT